MKDLEALEKGRLLKESLKIVDELAKNDLADIDGDFTMDDFDWDKLQRLIIKARDLKKNRWWNLT
jgi:hypothetical protein